MFLWRFNTGITRGIDLLLAPCTAPALMTLSRVSLSMGHGDSGPTLSGRDLHKQPFQDGSLPCRGWSPGGLWSQQRKQSWGRLLGQKLMQHCTPQGLSAARWSLPLEASLESHHHKTWPPHQRCCHQWTVKRSQQQPQTESGARSHRYGLAAVSIAPLTPSV